MTICLFVVLEYSGCFLHKLTYNILYDKITRTRISEKGT